MAEIKEKTRTQARQKQGLPVPKGKRLVIGGKERKKEDLLSHTQQETTRFVREKILKRWEVTTGRDGTGWHEHQQHQNIRARSDEPFTIFDLKMHLLGDGKT